MLVLLFAALLIVASSLVAHILLEAADLSVVALLRLLRVVLMFLLLSLALVGVLLVLVLAIARVLVLLVLQHRLMLLVLLAPLAPVLILLLADVILMLALLLANGVFMLSGLLLALGLVTRLPGLLLSVVALVHVLDGRPFLRVDIVPLHRHAIRVVPIPARAQRLDLLHDDLRITRHAIFLLDRGGQRLGKGVADAR